MTTNNNPNPPGGSYFQLPSSSNNSLSITTPTMNFNQKKPRKKRSKFSKIDPNYSSNAAASSSSTVPKPNKKPDQNAPKITMPCSECGKKFWSWKALFGHMRCHPERQWRGINPPPNFRRNNNNIMTEEDHEVAQCLLILANGNEITYNYLQDDDDDVDNNLGILNNCQFECSCCKKVFGSHQALGGHRATHKNVKGCSAMEDSNYHVGQQGSIDVGESLQKVVSGDIQEETLGGGHHQCGICFKVFSSGQALGGHKRCHWESPPASMAETTRQGCDNFDLNLPACNGDDDHDGYPPGLALDLRLGL